MEVFKGNKSEEEFIASLHLTESEKKAFETLSASAFYKKGDILVREGEFLRKSFYVVSGIIRQYYIKDGEEKTTNFYTDNQSIISSISSINKSASKHYLQCIEDAEVKENGYDEELEIYKKFPRFEKLCRITTEEQLGEFQERFALFMTSTPEERYLHLLNDKANLINRVPQYQLASYLGIKAESLSRIRKRIHKKKN